MHRTYIYTFVCAILFTSVSVVAAERILKFPVSAKGYSDITRALPCVNGVWYLEVTDAPPLVLNPKKVKLTKKNIETLQKSAGKVKGFIQNKTSALCVEQKVPLIVHPGSDVYKIYFGN